MPSSIPVPQIKLGKIKERSQMCQRYTTDGRIKDVELPVLLQTCADDGVRAYLLDSDNQYYDEKTGTWVQLINEIDYVPLQTRIKPEKDDIYNDIGNTLFKITSEQAQAEQYRLAKQKNNWNRILTLASILIGGLIIVAGIVYIWG